jgi:hypothetical protein
VRSTCCTEATLSEIGTASVAVGFAWPSAIGNPIPSAASKGRSERGEVEVGTHPVVRRSEAETVVELEKDCLAEKPEVDGSTPSLTTSCPSGEGRRTQSALEEWPISRLSRCLTGFRDLSPDFTSVVAPVLPRQQYDATTVARRRWRPGV